MFQQLMLAFDKITQNLRGALKHSQQDAICASFYQTITILYRIYETWRKITHYTILSRIKPLGYPLIITSSQGGFTDIEWHYLILLTNENKSFFRALWNKAIIGMGGD